MSIETTAPSRKQPTWHVPAQKNQPTLRFQNSLTKTKTEFIPSGRTVTWYNCGPTVYDASHMGHARTYLAMDIIRRVLEDYFHYQVLFVQNVTDIDDKIILRARQEYLFRQLQTSSDALKEDLVAKVQEAWKEYAEKKITRVEGIVADPANDWPAFISAMTPENIVKALALDEKYKMKQSALQSSYDAIQKATQVLKQKQDQEVSKAAAQELLLASQEIVSVYLDKREGSKVNDPKIFRDLPAYWEDMFFKDMEALNVRAPDIQTRVSEYVPEIIAYVEKIIANGYAYAVDGSVYFDTTRYDGHKGHHYAKLEPWSKGDQALIEDGEGSLGSQLKGKKGPSDFALWKSSKPGEPEWDSPWGLGRPGWHIECSVMASAVLGENMDIHSGGIDLAFPHHDNEIAQSEAYHECAQWVNYFLHAGHLHVEGQKMSKSLKNFITIQEALQSFSARQIRLFFLRHQWDAKMDFKQSSMQETVHIETTIGNFFDNVKAILHRIRSDGTRGADEQAGGSITHRFRENEKRLLEVLQQKQEAVHVALCDSVNTPVAIEEIMTLINETNKYMAGGAKTSNPHLLSKVAKWITSMMKIFGVVENGTDIGFGTSSATETLMPYLHALSTYRDQVRSLARDQAPHKEFLTLCDHLRDTHMVDLGVALDDQEGKPGG
ncbi:cysteinyl-tRNA synthetase [Spinellus fusiger]|nr:cysteinyl-tRNA synthetase [Spinellus fusiger]